MNVVRSKAIKKSPTGRLEAKRDRGSKEVDSLVPPMPLVGMKKTISAQSKKSGATTDFLSQNKNTKRESSKYGSKREIEHSVYSSPKVAFKKSPKEVNQKRHASALNQLP